MGRFNALNLGDVMNEMIFRILERLNSGERITAQEVNQQLGPFTRP